VVRTGGAAWRLETGQGKPLQFGVDPTGIQVESEEKPRGVMPPHNDIGYHEGLTELLQIKRSMLRTVLRYGLAGLGAALLVALLVALINSSLWVDLHDFLRAATR
jgi:hypothetical protein